MMITSFLNEAEILKIGLKKIGENAQISKHACFYNPETIEIGNNVRIDDFCILSGNIKIGNHIHIAAFCSLFGSAGIEMEDFSNISSRVAIYSASDDFSGDFLVGPTIQTKFRNIISGKVLLQKHSLVGTGSTIFPGVKLATGSVLGAMSLLIKSTKDWTIYTGIPANALKDRSRNLLKFETNLI